jgi:hypothetical protein
MKILDLIKIKQIYVNLIIIAVLLPSLGGVGGGLYAQDPELFNHTWYLEKVNIAGQEYVLNDYYTSEIAYTILNDQDNTIFISYCEFRCFESSYSYNVTSNDFDFLYINDCPLTDECLNPDGPFYFYSDLYFSLFYFWDSVNQMVVIKNPFSCTVVSVNNYYQLTIENDEGNWAVYNSVLLTAASFSQNSFALYPNPVREILYVSNTFNQSVQVNIYDLNGKLLQRNVVNATQTQIDVRQLNTGLYFVVFESEFGERVSKKFVKK